MKKNEYVETLIIKDQVVNIGMDDYGQCYFAEWIDDDQKGHVQGLGTYNFQYLEEAYGIFDPKGVYVSLLGIESWNRQTRELIKYYKEEGIDKSNPKEFKELIDQRNSLDYGIYDFKKMYEERGL